MKPGGIEAVTQDGDALRCQRLYLAAKCIASKGFASVTHKSRHILAGQEGILRIGEFNAAWYWDLPREALVKFGQTPKVAEFIIRGGLEKGCSHGFPLARSVIKRRLHVWYFKGLAWELTFFEIEPPKPSIEQQILAELAGFPLRPFPSP